MGTDSLLWGRGGTYVQDVQSHRSIFEVKLPPPHNLPISTPLLFSQLSVGSPHLWNGLHVIDNKMLVFINQKHCVGLVCVGGGGRQSGTQ